MANFVLVHGAWGGGQSYDKTKRDLEAAGHNVLVTAVRGIGTRQSELHPGITLSDHIADVLWQIEVARFERFILVGHSYGGMVITGVAAKLGARIDAIAYIDAFLPESGQSLWDITGEFEHKWYIDSQKDNPGMVAPIGGLDFEPVPGLVGYHPLLTLLEAVRLSGEERKIPRRAYIFATGWQPTPFARFAEQVRDDPEWDYHEADCDHFVMENRPEITAKVLLGLAA
ncbi:MAG TPA: alpha/beta hydrolase [Sphingomonadaceae bacterium]|nr:alpha/beta hydrolase [Sphingomonadaceae bacterium]